MTRLLKVVIILGLLAVSAGCGQKGSLYMPAEHVAQHLGL
jgi:predicted small lipoprotein YifL